MTSTHDDYDAAARRHAAGLLRDEAKRLRGMAGEVVGIGGYADSLVDWAADLDDAADWLEAGS